MNNESNDNSRRRSSGEFQSLAKSILPLARHVLGKKGFAEVDILSNWNTIIGEELAAYTFPQKIDFKRGERTNGTLHLAVPSGAFALEVQHREKFILQKINTYFGYNAVSGLRIAQNAGISLTDMLPKESGRRPKKLVTVEEENYIKDLAEEINSPELKEILIKLGQSVFTDNNLKEKK